MRNIITDAGLLLMGIGAFMLSIFGMPIAAKRDGVKRLRDPDREQMPNELLGYIALALLAVGTVSQLLSPNPFVK